MEETFKSLLHENRIFKPSRDFSKNSHIKSLQEYKKIYKESIKSPEKFWAEKAKQLHWFKKWKKVLSKKDCFFKWFEGGKLNVCYNCLDKNIAEGKGNKAALIWEAEDGQTKKYTYLHLLQEVCKFANVLKKNNVKKGDRVCIYLPMIPELAIAMLSCARIGAIHSIVFGGFSSESLKDRIQDCKAKMLVTSDGSFRNGKVLPLKQNADAALKNCPTIKKVIVVQRCKNETSMKKSRDLWWHEEISKLKSLDCRAEEMNSEDPLFILYTSGCCHANSLIQLANGEIMRIKDMVDKNLKAKIINVHSNPFVQTEDRITHHHKYLNASLLLKVRTPSFEAIFTPNHRLFSLDGYGNLAEREVGNLNKGDKVFVASKINLEGKMQMLPHISPKKEYRNKTTYRPKNIPKISDFLTPNFAQILGYLAGDGHADIRSIIFTDKDKNNLRFYKNLIKNELNLAGIIRKIDGQRLLINSSTFANYIKEFFPEIIRKSRHRSVPKIIQRSENKCIAGFLRGLFDAEGTIGHSFVKLPNTSEELIRVIQLLLRRFGIISHVYPGKNKERQIKNHKIKETSFLDIIISQRESLNMFHEYIGFSHKIKKERLDGLMKKLSSKKSFPKERFPIFSLLKKITKTIKVDWRGEFNKITRFVYSNQTDKNGLRAIRDFLDIRIKGVKGEKLRKLELIRNKIQKLMDFKGVILEKVLEVKGVDDKSDFVYDLTAQKNHNYMVNGFITHNTTGKPKGVLHTQAGYLLYAYQTFKWVFDIKENDIYWCTADIGWITGHSYIIYGPLTNGAASLMYEGSPMYPDAGRFWKIIEKYKVTIFYTAPTAIRALMKQGDKFPNSYDLSSLRLLGTVGEPINPEAWFWYYNTIGKKGCPIVDTWWQTETGGILITPLPGATPLKPGSATLPFPGIEPDILKENGSKAKTDEGGYLVIKQPWPGMLRTIWGNPERYKKTYFGKFKNIYLTGDSARRDKDGYFWIMGRLDDVIKVSGHRLGTAEVESHIVSHKSVAEAAVVPIPEAIKGQAIYAFVTLKTGIAPSEKLREEIIKHVASNMGSIAKPEKLQFADDLPKTRSGKIMRRVLKSIAEGTKDYGNTSTLADPSVIDSLENGRIR